MFYLTRENLSFEFNTVLRTDQLISQNNIIIDRNSCFFSIQDNNLYYKVYDETTNEYTRRINIFEPNNPLIDSNFKLEIARASHNLFCFKDKNERNLAMGGINLWNDVDKNKKYVDGLYLFEVLENEINCLNDNKPIITKNTIGNYDGFYGTNQDKTDIEKCRNGIMKFDSTGSVIFNEKENMYFLYHRANPISGCRLVQYSKSSDLIHWSEFNLINLDIIKEYAPINIYYSNFFKVPNTDIVIGILPFCDTRERKLTTKLFNGIGRLKNMNLIKTNTPQVYVNKFIVCYSYDFVNFKYVGDLYSTQSYDLENLFLSTNYPKILDNKMYIYLSVLNKQILEVYTLGLNRFFYLTNNNYEESQIKTKLIELENNSIKMNLTVNPDGYLIAELYYENNEMITGFDFNNFDRLVNVDSTDVTVSWNSVSEISVDKVFMKIKFYKSKIYTIGGKCLLVS